jgi:hypothetical protein
MREKAFDRAVWFKLPAGVDRIGPPKRMVET